MDNFNSGKIKEMVYDVLQNPTRENFIDILDNGLGEQDNLDFKVQWIEAQKLAEILLGIANSGGGAIILGVKENEDGTVTLTVDAVCDMVICDDAVITHELTVKFADDGSFQYLGNEILDDGIMHIPDYQYRIKE
jgi:hypothetical protein